MRRDDAEDDQLEQELLQALEEGSDSDCEANPLPRMSDARKRPAYAPAADPAATPSSEARLPALPAPVLLRVLSHLSPEELCVAAATCRSLRDAAHDAALWRALYFARWRPAGDADAAGDVDRPQDSWKARYHERDEAEVQAQLERAPLRELYLQMATAKRSEKLSPAQREGVFAAHASDAPGPLASRVAAFRRSLGLPASGHTSSTSASPPGGTLCTGGCSFVELGPAVYVCCRGGEVHLCGDACGEREIDPSSTLPVCRITGRCFVHDFEVGDAGGAAARDDAVAAGDGGDDWNEQEGVGGRLGRAFLAGYNAVDEREMLHRFGVKL